MSHNSVPDEVLDKIQKVLALAENAGTEGEAAAAAAAAARLLQKYNLTITDMDAWELSRDNNLGEVTVLTSEALDKDSARKAGWVHLIVHGVGESHFCHPLVTNRQVHFVGRDRNARSAILTFAYLYHTLCSLVEVRKLEYKEEFFRQNGFSPWGVYSPATWRTSWLDGAARVIYDRLRAELAQAVTTSAIVPMTNDENRKYIYNRFGKTKGGRSRDTRTNWSAYTKGAEDGQKLNLHPDRQLDE